MVSEARRIRCYYEPCHADEETEGQRDTLLCPPMRAQGLFDLAASTPSQPPVGGPLCPWAESALPGTPLPHQALGGLSRCCGSETVGPGRALSPPPSHQLRRLPHPGGLPATIDHRPSDRGGNPSSGSPAGSGSTLALTEGGVLAPLKEAPG